MKSKIICTCILFIMLLISTACSDELSATPVKPVESNAEATLFSDDFSNPSSGWGVWNRGGALVEYHNGGLRILVHDPQYDFWSVAGQEFSDVQVEADVFKIGGPDDNDFGVICRYQNKDNFYMLVISSDGYYGVAKMKEGQYSLMGTEQLQYSNAIAQSQAANHLRADCVGSTLALYANGQQLTEVQDTDFPSGDVGVTAGAYDISGVDILFDNFVVKKPK